MEFIQFQDKLKEYIELVGCSAKELAEHSGLSAATISRYCNGKRIPESEETLLKLASGLAVLAQEKELTDITKESIMETFSNYLNSNFHFEAFRNNFNTLLSALSISLSDLSRALKYDSSYLSRIRSGQRQPADPQKFVAEVAQFITRRYNRTTDISAIAQLTGHTPESLEDTSARLKALMEWLCSEEMKQNDPALKFLQKLDEFDLNEYIRAIRFDELKVPTVPFQLPTSKSYFGLKEMMASELDFLKTTVLSKSMENVIMYSDMPMEEMSKDPEFPKKWMFGMAMMLKKGLHLNMIHNVDRPFNEMMLGLESYIPMYMTGQISPYYLKGIQNNNFLHFLKVSGSAALTGEAITGFHSKGKYYLTKNKEEVAYYKTRANCLLQRALPLMEIYRSDSENAFNAFLSEDAEVQGNRRAILSSLPLYTITDELLEQILQKNGIIGKDKGRIMTYAATQRERTLKILEHSSITDEIPSLSTEEFEKYPMVLSLSGVFYEKDICYNYEDYLEHCQLTKDFAQKHPNYTAEQTGSHAFRNIQIIMHEGKWAMVSKGKAPAIHFVIRHPKMCNAIENFIPPM